jgi:hypothetical protein
MPNNVLSSNILQHPVALCRCGFWCAALSFFSLLIHGHSVLNIPLVGYPLLDAADAAIMASLK